MKKKRLLGILLSLALMVTMMPTMGLTAYAGTDTGVKYLDSDGTEKTCTTYNEVVNSDASVYWESDWYVVKGTVRISGGIHASGDVHLILCDGANLTVSTGSGNAISVNGDFTIYAQSTGQNMGVLSATTTDTWSGISVANTDHDVMINGGTIIANGGYYGIKSEYSDVIINGGNITAIASGTSSSGIYAYGDIEISKGTVNFASAAADNKNYYDIHSEYGGITIGGGTVNATGEYAIYANNNTDEKKKNIVISGGTVNAMGKNGIRINDGNVNINGGTVNTTGNGNGIYAARGDITITNGDITVTGSGNTGIQASNITIGGGNVTVENKSTQNGIQGTQTVTINGGNVTAKGGYSGIEANAIGGAGGGMTINGGTVTATGGQYGIFNHGELSIGNSNVGATGGSNGILTKKITINGGTVTATGTGDSSEGISTGTTGEKVIINSGDVTANGKLAGINAKTDVEIKGGAVNAEGTGANNSYGIYANNNVTIEGGTVNARGNADSGIRSNGNNIIISGGKVTAIGKERGLHGNVKNSMAGTGWTDTEGKTGRAKININTDPGQTLTFNRVEFPEASEPEPTPPTPPTPSPSPAPSVVPAAPVEIQDLPAVKISKPAKGKKAITVKWKKISKKKLKKSKKRIDGIEIQVSGPGVDQVVTAGKKKTSKKIKGLLPKQKYICRVRAYNYTDGVKHVSAWSKWKTAKTKK